MAGLTSQSWSLLQWVAAHISVQFCQPCLSCWQFAPHAGAIQRWFGNFPQNWCTKCNVPFLLLFFFSLIYPPALSSTLIVLNSVLWFFNQCTAVGCVQDLASLLNLTGLCPWAKSLIKQEVYPTPFPISKFWLSSNLCLLLDSFQWLQGVFFILSRICSCFLW